MDRDLSLYRLLRYLAEQGTGFRYEDGEYRAYCEDQILGETNRFEIRHRPGGGYRYFVNWQEVDRDRFLASAVRLPVDRLRAMEEALRVAEERRHTRLLELLHRGWRFPDDGRVSFSWVRSYPGGGKWAAIVYLDRRDQVAYELDGRKASRQEFLAETGRPEEELAELESVLRDTVDAS